MCLAIPAKVIEINGPMATVDIAGNSRQVGIILTPEAQPGDYVLVHAGFAIQIIDETEAQETLAIFEEWAEKDKEFVS
ncbi:MAG: HypC/HybG/HupF family hydrogenase formation chaperone [Bacillota bacterium]|jgi:hydrogenase expression/formation protein HypC